MTTVTASNLKINHRDVLGRVQYSHERIAVTYHGKEIAAMVPMEDVRLLERLEEALDALDAIESIHEANREGTVSLPELRKQLGR